jgi:transposase
LYQAPPANTHVLCLDEMGPVSAKTYPAPRWCESRPHLKPDYGRRAKVWVFGAFEPRTGHALTLCTDGRGAIHFIDLLEALVKQWPTGELILILDNLAAHKTLDVRLWVLAHERVRFLFQPTYAPWLNLIEPWWKTLRSLALKGRRFNIKDELIQALIEATEYWNQHRKPYIWRRLYS